MNAAATLKRASSVYRWLLVLAVLFSAAGKANAQVTVQVGNGTANLSYIPIYSCFGYNYSQAIYLQSEMAAAGATGASLITKIRYYYNTATPSSTWNNWTIYMGNTTQATYGTTTSWIPSSGLTQVFSGTISVPSSSGQWLEIPLATPFYWDGTSNLVVAVDENVPSWSCTAGWRSEAIGSSTNYRCILYYNDNTNPNPASPPTANYRTNSIPNTQFEVIPAIPCAGVPNGGTAVATPGAPCYNASTAMSLTGATLGTGLTYQWQQNTGSGWVPAVGGTGATTANYTTPAISGTIQYRCRILCTNSGDSAFSVPDTVNAAPQSPPYIETFESITANNTLPSCMSATNLGSYVYTYTAPTGSYNQTNHTPGGSKFASFRYGANDHIFSPALNLVGGQLYQFSFWYITDGLSGWNTLRASYGTAPNASSMTNALVTVSNATNTTYQLATAQFTPATSGTYYFGINCQASGVPWYLSIDDINIVPLPPCSGTPTAGTITPAGPISGCPGMTYSMTTTGTTTAANLSYQWIQATNAAPNTYAAAVGTGATTQYFTTGVLSDTMRYRMVVTCNNSGLRDTTPVMIVNVPRVPYASLPFLEDFESWSTRCNTTDIPSQYWTNIPSTGNPSWRRHDQGASAGWTSPTTGSYSPVAVSGSYSARFHNYYATPNNTRGRMDLYVNCASVTGNKELQFFMRMDNSTFATGDTLFVSMSTNGGGTFTQLGAYATTNGWEMQSLPIVSNSATTVIRFEGKSYNYYTDFGLDKVQVLPPCSGKPTAGAVNQLTPCSGQNFNLTLNGTSQVAGLTYLWQQSANGTTWTPVTAGTTPIVTTSITSPTWYRCIVTCSNSSQSDTTAASYFGLASFYYCYCGSGATNGSYEDIGNVTITTQPANTTILNNGTSTTPLSNATAVNTYSNFTSLPPTVMYRDSLYKGSIAQITGSTYMYSCGIAIYIDYNRNGTYDPDERVLNKTSNSTSSPANPYLWADTFRVPANAGIGLTGMRVVMVEFGTANPCGTYTYGETEDYLVDLRYPPCEGPTNAGVATISDSTMCIGYDVVLIDTTHEKQRSGIQWDWQTSTDGGLNWSAVAGTQGKDTVVHTVTGAASFRLRMICTITGDTTYSNAVNVTINQPWQCYCYSIAVGKNKDTTDVGAFAIGNFMMPLTNIGPHLLNPAARRDRTDFTDVTGLQLWADTTYQVDIFQTMPTSIHADARITMFIDYNNNLQYDIPEERVLTVITSPTNWYTVSQITIPNAVIADVPTGLRVIINNNVNPNSPSDDACGAYTSGETEDYVVTLRRGVPAGVGHVGLIRDLSLYPNPTEGRFTVQFNTVQVVKDLKLVVTNLTGQQVTEQHFAHPSRQFRTEMDLSHQPKGVYLVEVHADGNKMVRKLIVR